MTITKKEIGLISLFIAAAILAVFLSLPKAQLAYGAGSPQVPGVTLHTINPPTETQDFYTFFIATTTTATSTSASSASDPGYLRVGGAKDVLFYFSRGDTKGTGNAGSTAFKVQVTPDGTNWLDYNELGQITTSATGDVFFTRVGSASVPAGTSTVQYVMEDISYYAVRCIAVRTTDGEATCKATANF